MIKKVVRNTASAVRNTASAVRNTASVVRNAASPVRNTSSPVRTLPVRSGIMPSKLALFRTWHYSGPLKVVRNSARAG